MKANVENNDQCSRSEDEFFAPSGAGPRWSGNSSGESRQAGRLSGRVTEAFFEPLPVEELEAWQGK